MLVRLSGEFDAAAQPALRKAFGFVRGPVTIDVSDAWLSSTALAEVVCLAKRIGTRNVTLANPAPILRRLLSTSRMDRLVTITQGPGA